MAMTKDKFKEESTTPQQIFDEMMLEFLHNNSKKLVGILVEGKSNEVLFRKLLSTPKCRFYQSNGWENVLTIVEKTNLQKSKGVIGIIDADFKRILGQKNTIDNLFWTDYHDTEIMCVYSPVWDNILNQYYQKDKFENFTNTNGEDFRGRYMTIFCSCKKLSFTICSI